jgi:hypothetical protein
MDATCNDFKYTPECSDNHYGPDCSQTCGKCREDKQCHHINGSCSDGCDTGYKGDKCDEGVVCWRELYFKGILSIILLKEKAGKMHTKKPQ